MALIKQDACKRGSGSPPSMRSMGPVCRPVEYSRNLGTISSEINVNSLIMLLGISTPLAADVLYGWPYALYA